MAVVPGRWTARVDGEFVLFLIGMRANALWRVGRWWPVARAMRSMLRELSADPTAGLLAHEAGWLRGGPMPVQYWRDLERLIGSRPTRGGRIGRRGRRSTGR